MDTKNVLFSGEKSGADKPRVGKYIHIVGDTLVSALGETGRLLSLSTHWAQILTRTEPYLSCPHPSKLGSSWLTGSQLVKRNLPGRTPFVAKQESDVAR